MERSFGLRWKRRKIVWDIESLVAGSGGTLIVDNIGFKHEPIEVSTEKTGIQWCTPIRFHLEATFTLNGMGNYQKTVFLVNMQGTYNQNSRLCLAIV